MSGLIVVSIDIPFGRQLVASDTVATIESITVGSMALGGIYGIGDAVVRGADPFKSAWDGAKLGAALPGMIAGGVAGMAIGGLIHVVTFQPMTEAVWVGWGSLGSVAGVATVQTVMFDSRAKRINQWVSAPQTSGVGYLVSGTYELLYWGNATAKAIEFGTSAKSTYKTDTEMHYWTFRQLREATDPGTAATFGFAKEAGDYFLRIGTPEFRDLRANWHGVFLEDLTK